MSQVYRIDGCQYDILDESIDMDQDNEAVTGRAVVDSACAALSGATEAAARTLDSAGRLEEGCRGFGRGPEGYDRQADAEAEEARARALDFLRFFFSTGDETVSQHKAETALRTVLALMAGDDVPDVGIRDDLQMWRDFVPK